MGTTKIVDQKTPRKTTLPSTCERRKPPFETLSVGECLVRAKALLKNAGRRGPSMADASAWARRLTRLEDWLEYEHPHDDRAPLTRLRRLLEARL